MIAVIDNYDSFTYNLVQFLGEIVKETPLPGGEESNLIQVWRNDAIDVEELIGKQPNHVIISPGPGSPKQDSGISNDVIRHLGDRTPILGKTETRNSRPMPSQSPPRKRTWLSCAR